MAISKDKANKCITEYLNNGFNKTAAVYKVNNYGSRKNAKGQATRDFNRYAKVCDIKLGEIDEVWIIDKLVYHALHSKNENNKVRALELLAKWRALLTEKTETLMTQQLTEDTIQAIKQLETNKQEYSRLLGN